MHELEFAKVGLDVKCEVEIFVFLLPDVIFMFCSSGDFTDISGQNSAESKSAQS